MVNIGLRVLARPDQAMLPKLYQQLGQDYDERVLPSIINEVNSVLRFHQLSLLCDGISVHKVLAVTETKINHPLPQDERPVRCAVLRTLVYVVFVYINTQNEREAALLSSAEV